MTAVVDVDSIVLYSALADNLAIEFASVARRKRPGSEWDAEYPIQSGSGNH